jgi:hypothetical protein
MSPRRLLQWAFCLFVLCLTLWRLSENSVDPDLWGHVIFGQRMLHLGQLELTEPFSWTANGYPWINHEIGAELIMGATHNLFGGPGLLLLTVSVGLLTIGLALKMGADQLPWPQRAVALGILIIAAREIAFGFSVRPQIFTAIALVVMLWSLRKLHAGKTVWAAFLPVLFCLWINTHGGALAGLVLLVITACSTTFQWLTAPTQLGQKFHLEEIQPKTVGLLWLTTLFSFAAMCLNPWGLNLIRWLIESVSWFRPEIAEWNPPRFGSEHAGVFALMGLAAFAYLCSRKKHRLWEAAVVGALAVIAARHARHVPLFSIAALAFIPVHLADSLGRFAHRFENLTALFRHVAVQRISAAALGIVSLIILFATATYHKEKFHTIEVPRNEYPNAAIDFIRDYELRGNLLVFFDWGEQCIWELPESSVSIDGRLDTCYSRELLREHWNFFEGKPVNAAIFDINKADFALLRQDVAGVFDLKKVPGWTVEYEDPLAIILVRKREHFPKLRELKAPVNGGPQAIQGRDPFPKTRSANSLPARH